MTTLFRAYGVALQNKANEIVRVGDALGPVTLIVDNNGANPVVVSVNRLSDGALVLTQADTAVTGENTGYVGTGAQRLFTGQLLNVLPVVPGSVMVRPTAGGATVNAKDTYADGNLWSIETTSVVCGTVNYFTGALNLNYPVGKAPAAGVISADYANQDATTKPLGKRSVQVGNLPPSETLIVSAAASAGSSQLKLDAVISF